MKLRGDFGIRCPGTFWDSDTVKNRTFPFSFPTKINPITMPVFHAAAKTLELRQIISALEHPIPVLETASTAFETILTAPFSTPGTTSLTFEATTVSPEEANSAILELNTTPSHPTSAPLIIVGSPLRALLCPLSLRRSILALIFPYYLAALLLVLVVIALSHLSARSISPSPHITFLSSTDRSWKIKVLCAGKKSSINGNNPAVIVAPSEEQETRRSGSLVREELKVIAMT